MSGQTSMKPEQVVSPAPLHPPWSQASARAVMTDVGDITAHQSSFNKSPFDTAHTMVSL